MADRMRITTIDDLKGLSKDQIRRAGARLQIRRRIEQQMEREARQVSPTLDAYRAILQRRRDHPIECPTCAGTGSTHLPKPREVGCIHPSSAGVCRLRLYYDVTGELEARNYIKHALQFVFCIGHAMHDLTQGVLTRALADVEGAKFRAEPQVDMGLVRGNTDGDGEVDDVGFILEIKSDGGKFETRSGPDQKHRLQAGALYTLGLCRPFTVYLYLSKKWPHPMKEYVEPYDPQIFRRWWRDKGEHVQNALEDGRPPRADAAPAECAECPYGYDGGCPSNTAGAASRAFKRSGK